MVLKIGKCGKLGRTNLTSYDHDIYFNGLFGEAVRPHNFLVVIFILLQLI